MVNPTLEGDWEKAARLLGLNVGRIVRIMISEAAKVEQNRLWREENQAALAICSEEVVRNGLPLTQFRSF